MSCLIVGEYTAVQVCTRCHSTSLPIPNYVRWLFKLQAQPANNSWLKKSKKGLHHPGILLHPAPPCTFMHASRTPLESLEEQLLGRGRTERIDP